MAPDLIPTSTGSTEPAPPRGPRTVGKDPPVPDLPSAPPRAQGPPQAAARSQGQSAPVHSGRPQGASALSITSSRKPDVEAMNRVVTLD